MASMQKLLVLTLSSLIAIQAHTWLGCTDYKPDGSCRGFIRNYFGRNPPSNSGPDIFYTNKLLGSDNEFLICKSDTQANPTYSAQFPRATAQAGSTLKTMYTPNGHSAPGDVGATTDARIHWNKGPNGPSGSLVRRRDLNDANRLARTNYAANCQTTGDVASLPCVNPYTIPANTPPGVYQFVWYWPYNKNADQRPFGEEYFSCFEVEVTAGNGSPPPPPPPAPVPVPVPGPGSTCANPLPVGNGNGLVGQYFKGTNFNQFLTQRTDALIAFDYGFGAPPGIAGIDADRWTIRWMGLIEPRWSGLYTFYTISDDGCRLWVRNQLLVNDFTPHGKQQFSGQITLTAGTRVGLRMEYLEVDQTAVVYLQWSHQCISQDNIPTSQMFPNTNIGFDEGCAAYDGKGTGLVATYFNGNDATSAAIQTEGPNDNRVDTVPSNVAADWRVQWAGFILPSFSEVYTFSVISAKGVKLTINNVIIVDNTVAHEYTENNGTIPLTSGSAVPISIEYWSNGVDKNNDVSLSWSTPKCLAVELVPKNYLFTTLEEIPTSDDPNLENGSSSVLLSILLVAIVLLC